MFILIVVSCSKLEEEKSQLLSNLESRAIVIHPEYNALGWGYDITGSQMSYKSVKSPVVDIYRYFIEGYKDHIYIRSFG